MLERAKYLLITELATARNATMESMETVLVKSLAKAHLRSCLLQVKKLAQQTEFSALGLESTILQ